MDIEKEILKLRLIEAQAQVLQYQHKEISASISKAQAEAAQTAFDASVDARDMPTGAALPQVNLP